jgi:hypothetical protein
MMSNLKKRAYHDHRSSFYSSSSSSCPKRHCEYDSSSSSSSSSSSNDDEVGLLDTTTTTTFSSSSSLDPASALQIERTVTPSPLSLLLLLQGSNNRKRKSVRFDLPTSSSVSLPFLFFCDQETNPRNIQKKQTPKRKHCQRLPQQQQQQQLPPQQHGVLQPTHHHQYTNNNNNNNDDENGYGNGLLWWTKHERIQIAEDNRAVVRDFQQDHGDQIQHFLHGFVTALASAAAGEPQLMDAKSKSSDADAAAAAGLTLPASVRGLEGLIAPSLKQHRNVHAQQLLILQDELDDYELLRTATTSFSSSSLSSSKDFIVLTPDLRVQLLAQCAIQSSRPSCILARLLGQGDAHTI